MSFLRHGRSLVRWDLGPGAKQTDASLPPSHRLDESQLDIPRRVALLQSPPPLHQPISSSRPSAANVNLTRRKVGEFSTGIMRSFQPELTCRQPTSFRCTNPRSRLPSRINATTSPTPLIWTALAENFPGCNPGCTCYQQRKCSLLNQLRNRSATGLSPLSLFNAQEIPL
jgi:hypothetical protein